jgi:hypothetical protein
LLGFVAFVDQGGKGGLEQLVEEVQIADGHIHLVSGKLVGFVAEDFLALRLVEAEIFEGELSALEDDEKDLPAESLNFLVDALFDVGQSFEGEVSE